MLFLRSLFFTVLLPGTVTVLVPWRIVSRERAASLGDLAGQLRLGESHWTPSVWEEQGRD